MMFTSGKSKIPSSGQLHKKLQFWNLACSFFVLSFNFEKELQQKVNVFWYTVAIICLAYIIHETLWKRLADVSQQSYQSLVRHYFIYRKISVLCSDSYGFTSSRIIYKSKCWSKHDWQVYMV